MSEEEEEEEEEEKEKEKEEEEEKKKKRRIKRRERRRRRRRRRRFYVEMKRVFVENTVLHISLDTKHKWCFTHPGAIVLHSFKHTNL
jgi:hypothetical protein